MREGVKYFGVPTCPYCKKRVNLIRTWSLKKQGEYCCPRCGGISNIYLSPLIYVFALLAIFSGGAMYFFHKFVLDDVSLPIVGQVMLPFAVFFLLSLFMVYLAKPVIKKVPKTKIERKRRQEAAQGNQRRGSSQQASQMFYDDQEYLPKGEYVTGEFNRRETDDDMKIVPSGARKAPAESSAVRIPADIAERRARPAPAERVEDPSPVQQTVAQKIAAARAAAPKAEAPAPAEPASQQRSVVDALADQAETVSSGRRAEPMAEPRQKPQPSASGDDFFSKYNDPDYVQRRLQELKTDRGDQN